VYVAGYSSGGLMAIRLVHEIPGRLAGAVIISATQPIAESLEVDDRHLSVPVVLIHGTLDPVVPYVGGIASMWGLRSSGSGLSAFDSAQYFAWRNGITAAATSEQVRHRPESGKTSVTRQRWEQAGKDSVTLYTVTNGGHVIPNPRTRASFLGRTTRDINAATRRGPVWCVVVSREAWSARSCAALPLCALSAPGFTYPQVLTSPSAWWCRDDGSDSEAVGVAS
jgi:polyhydroxybutyrate depolymerase